MNWWKQLIKHLVAWLFILIIEAKNAWSKILEYTLHLQVKIVILIQNTLFCTQ